VAVGELGAGDSDAASARGGERRPLSVESLSAALLNREMKKLATE
jgi:hypothetical protein